MNDQEFDEYMEGIHERILRSMASHPSLEVPRSYVLSSFRGADRRNAEAALIFMLMRGEVANYSPDGVPVHVLNPYRVKPWVGDGAWSRG